MFSTQFGNYSELRLNYVAHRYAFLRKGDEVVTKPHDSQRTSA